VKRISIVIFMLVFMFGGCTSFKQRTTTPPSGDASPAAKALLSRLESRNSDLITFKASGRIRLENIDGIQHARAMWAGYRDEKIRLEILGPSGQPMASFASDGDHIYLISHADNRFYSKRSPKASLEKLIHVPLQVNESLDLLTGRIPSSADRSATFLKESTEGIQILIAKKHEKGTPYDKIYFNSQNNTIQKLESFDKDGYLKFRVEIKDMYNTGGFRVPEQLVISDGGNNRLDLSVDRFWPNVPVSDALFVLSKP